MRENCRCFWSPVQGKLAYFMEDLCGHKLSQAASVGFGILGIRKGVLKTLKGLESVINSLKEGLAP